MCHTVTSREFGHNVSAAKHQAEHGPVFITNRGTPEFVLLHIDAYRALGGRGQETSLLEAMHRIQGAGKGIELELPARELDGDSRIPDFSGESGA